VRNFTMRNVQYMSISATKVSHDLCAFFTPLCACSHSYKKYQI
jgi:hypothetical protein